MTLLPPVTELPRDILPRVHVPVAAEYQSYRDCLRWEFGFTCVLCFLHESDLVEGGADGTGLIWIEHVSPKGKDESRRDEYGNCLLSCRFCNNARAARPIQDPSGAQLLSPTAARWGEHFRYVDHAMAVVAENDRDAQYTHRVYALGSPRKTALRETRATLIRHFLHVSDEAPEMAQALLAEARNETDSQRRTLLIHAAEQLLESHDLAARIVERYRAVPVDAPPACTCPERELELPSWLASQVESGPGLKAD
jgi:hypothetical protein